MYEKIIPGLLIAALSWVCIGILIYGLHLSMIKAGWDRRYRYRVLTWLIFGTAAWLLLVGLLSIKGFFSNFSAFPPRPAMVIFLPLPLMLFIAVSRKFSELLLIIPPSWLIFMQGFRIAVELILFMAFINGLLPEQMTFEGLNFDVFTGLLALPVGYFCFIKKSWPRVFAVIFNFMGLLLLVIVLVIAVLSMPLPIRYFHHEPSTAVVGSFPFIYLPSVLVVIAYTLHLFSLRQLFLLKKKNGD